MFGDKWANSGGHFGNILMSLPALPKINLWDFGLAMDGVGDDEYPGRRPGQIVKNLLWY